jgi:hypothetical protein
MISGTGLLLALGLVALLGLAVVIVWWVYRTPPGYRRSRQEDLPLFSVSLVESRRTPARPQVAVAGASTNGSSARSYPPVEPSRSAGAARARAVPDAAPSAPTRTVPDVAPSARAHESPSARATLAAQVAPPERAVSTSAPAAPADTATPPASATAVREVRHETRQDLRQDPRQYARPEAPPTATPTPPVERRAENRPEMQAAGAAQIVSPDGVPGTQIEGHLLRFSVPQDGTLQFLPGRLEILNGLDVGREVRFVRVPGADGTRVTFGRSEGPVYRHVQLREGTVSRQHAIMELRDSQWHLTNLSATNPVVYNEQVLEVSEVRPLTDGDRIEMGEVVFGFRSR